MDTWPHQLSHFSPGRHTANEGTQCECHDLLLGCIPLFCHWLSPDDNHNNHVYKCLSSAQRKLKLECVVRGRTGLIYHNIFSVWWGIKKKSCFPGVLGFI